MVQDTHNKNIEDVKAFADIIHELINTWNGLSPPISNVFVIAKWRNHSKQLKQLNHLFSED